MTRDDGGTFGLLTGWLVGCYGYVIALSLERWSAVISISASVLVPVDQASGYYAGCVWSYVALPMDAESVFSQGCSRKISKLDRRLELNGGRQELLQCLHDLRSVVKL